MNVVFMGTPGFAVPTLAALIEHGYRPIVYTRPPSESGRGQEVVKSEVHRFAGTHSLSVFTPSSLKDPEELEKFFALKPDVVVLVAYGLLIPAAIVERILCLNIHPSLLPRWRGAAPIERAIMAGDSDTAVCIMRMDAGLDTGDIALKRLCVIDNDMTVRQLSEELARVGASLMLEALELWRRDQLTLTAQSEDGVTYAHKLTKADERIDWVKPGLLVKAQVRALSPKPGAYFIYKDEIIKVIAADYQDISHNDTPGMVLDDRLSVACGEGVIRPTLLQRQGRKMIYTEAFLRGFNIEKGAMLCCVDRKSHLCHPTIHS